MRIAIFGAGGVIGQLIAREVLSRGHEVTAVVRDVTRAPKFDAQVTVVRGDAMDAASVASVAKGADAAVSAVSPVSSLTAVARALIAGLPRAGVKRLIIVGGAGSLLMPDGKQQVDEPNFPAMWKPGALAQRDALEVYRAQAGALDWTYISPASEMMSGERTGRYRVGGDHVLTDATGQSRISNEDYAVAVVDELERPAHLRQRITVAY